MSHGIGLKILADQYKQIKNAAAVTVTLDGGGIFCERFMAF
jgi:hypothetical protein